jgi:capsid protein
MMQEFKLFGIKVASWGTPEIKAETTTPDPQANAINGYPGWGGGYGSMPIFQVFDGEKSLGGAGAIKKYLLDHDALRLRGWQLFLTSDICQIAFNRKQVWKIGSGLRLEAEPNGEVLDSEGITIDTAKFCKTVESRFKIYSSSRNCSYTGMKNMVELTNDGDKEATVSGDAVVILRYINGCVKIEIKDACYLQTPNSYVQNGFGDYINPITKNRIRKGIEINDRGQHVAFWLRKSNDLSDPFSFERVEARLKVFPYSEMAWVWYGNEYRLDSVRGMPIITAVIETANKMDRYREAELGKAEELAKIVYSLEPELNASMQDPRQNHVSVASGFGANSDLPTDSYGRELANRVAATTGKSTFMMTPGMKMNSLSSDNTNINFEGFFGTNFKYFCAVVNIPPEIALAEYNSNYAAARAGIKDFQHTLLVDRLKTANQFQQKVYAFWLDMEVLTNKIDAPGYIKALQDQNYMVLEAYRCATWVGDMVPNIDEYKEVMATRLKLGTSAAHIPLMTVEQAIEQSSGSDADTVIKQFAREQELAESLGIEPPEKPGMESEDDDPDEENPKPKPTKKPAK